MKYFRLLFLGILILFSLHTIAQDSHFSQYNSSPLTLNPALTGSINGKGRIVSNYRNQWQQLLQNDAYNSFSLSYDHRENFKSGDYLGLGVSFIGDVAGESRFRTMQLALSVSFSKIIFKSGAATHSLIGGLQYGLAQRRISVYNLRWSTNGPSGYGPSGIVGNPDFLFNDFNGGLIWVSSFGERKSFYAGVSTFHLNRPNVSFQQNSVVALSMRTAVHAGAELPLSSRLTLLPSIMYQKQGVHAQLNLGTMLSKLNSSDAFISNVQGGVYFRVGQGLDGDLQANAVVGIISIQVEGVQLGLSYDYMLSSLKNYNASALEISLGYVLKKTNREGTPFDVPQL